VLGILALGLTWWAAGEGYTMRGESKQTGSKLAGRIEARISQSGKPGLEKVRLGVLLHADNIQTTDVLFKALKDGGQDDEYARLGYAKTRILAGRGDGLAHLRELYRQYPNNPMILYELAMFYLRLGSEKEGYVLLKRVVEIDPFHALANYELAKWSAASSQPDKAIEYARRVLCVEDPGSPLAEKALLLLDKLIPENKEFRGFR
jgi:predicted Zn-dependent protease